MPALYLIRKFVSAEIFTVGERDFHLVGLGAYLQTAAHAGDVTAIVRGLAALVVVIVLLDQLVGCSLLAWADKFKPEMAQVDEPPESWAYALWQRSRLGRAFYARVRRPFLERLGARVSNLWATTRVRKDRAAWLSRALLGSVALGIVGALGWGVWQALARLIHLPLDAWTQIARGASVLELRLRVGEGTR